MCLFQSTASSPNFFQTFGDFGQGRNQWGEQAAPLRHKNGREGKNGKVKRGDRKEKGGSGREKRGKGRRGEKKEREKKKGKRREGERRGIV